MTANATADRVGLAPGTRKRSPAWAAALLVPRQGDEHSAVGAGWRIAAPPEPVGTRDL